jgi:hypothetical protein
MHDERTLTVSSAANIFQDPSKKCTDIDPTAEQQEGSGLVAKLRDTADRGEDSHRGTGRREGRKAVALPGTIADTAVAKKLVDDPVATLSGVDIVART